MASFLRSNRVLRSDGSLVSDGPLDQKIWQDYEKQGFK